MWQRHFPRRRDIIVEAVMFLAGPALENHPLFAKNNVNGLPEIEPRVYLSLEILTEDAFFIVYGGGQCCPDRNQVFFRPDPLFFPPPSSLFTVAQARASALFVLSPFFS